ncbi:MAG: ribose-5-phosphate isomerase RpiA [Chloroflexota bacterium]
MNFKQQAARHALSFVRSGMSLGLGTGSTAAYFIEMLGQALQKGALTGIAGVPSSERTAALARQAGIPLADLADHPWLDLAVDGADEIDPAFNLIKGLGRALLREKIVELHSRRFIVIGDESKLVARLGRGPLPVEMVPFGVEAHVRWLNTLGCRAEWWREADGSPAVTDNGNYLARCWFPEGIAEPHALSAALAERPGIVEHGLFLGLATDVIVAGPGGVRLLERAS